MGNIKVILITVAVVFTIINILSVNVFHPSIYDSKIEKAFQTAAEIRHKATTKDIIEDPKNKIIYDHSGNIMNKLKSKDIYSFTTTLDRLLYHFPYNEDDDVELNIFQIWKDKKIIDDNDNDNDDFGKNVLLSTECKNLAERWRDANLDHDYILYSISEAEDAVADLLRPTVPEIIDALRLLPNERLKFEFLKYLLLFLNGGVYSDIDTVNVKPIKFWYQLSMIKTKVWLGIDSDLNSPDWSDHYIRRLSFNNNIMRSKSHHPLFAKLIARITYIIFTQKDIINSINWDVEFSNIDASGAPLVQFTGTSILTDTAFEYMNGLQNYAFFTSLKNKNYGKENAVLMKPTFGPIIDKSQRFSYKKFTLLSSPVQVYDVAILPKISFTGHDSAEVDYYDDNNEQRGYEKFYYGRSKELTDWSPKKLRLDSN
ncbi:membrane-bound alpha-1,6- mannosyltransferase Initiation-specific [Pichia californica]|uniref:Membrane-bound alpha-1,6- mannosyltransferase Initiation-specific n=1 Tax=Pichia californica TaxID=460514 RepID=A0A9P6WM89_9ASCO|nr:membrane-bound alpha-1,6- mannosyltransferase Initiation-specific [[Candida] californica]KAG0689739.1 membrane-bound alpha-1,6- mannosyltransferase Initiation-specific [[Candida] californica]